MNTTFKTVAIVGRQNTPNAAINLEAVIKYLQSQKINIILELQTSFIIPNCKLPAVTHDKLKQNCDLIVVVGGDGSMLNAARTAATQNLPVTGINRGTIGFLADIPPTNISKINEILAGQYYEEQRLLINAHLQYEDQTIYQSLALNDIVLLSSNAGHMMEFLVNIDDQFVCEYRADGLIISTPTGSTAHSLSGGGPILHPTLDAIGLIPMFSHNLSSRPIIINANSTISIVFVKTNSYELKATCDGQQRILLPPGGRITITKAENKLRLLHPLDYNYFETLRTKLHWERNFL